MLNHDRMLLAFASILALILMPLAVLAEEQTQEGTAPRVVISEVGWAGSEVNNSDEWLELTNLGDEVVDLTGWSLVGGATGGDTLGLPDDAMIQPNSTYLITNYALDDEKSTLNVESDFTTTSLSLSNSSFGISLQDASLTIVDVAGDGGAPPAGSTSSETEEGDFLPRSSMQRVDCDGMLDESWVSTTESVGFEETATELGAPGALESLTALESCETFNYQPYDTNQDDSQTTDEDSESDNEDPTTETDPTDPTSTYDNMIINEFVSDPVTGNNEWVEIYNPTDSVYILAGYQIREASGKTTDLPDQYLASGQFVVVEKISGNLNNSGDTIELLDPEGVVLDQVTYGDGSEAPTVSDPLAVARNENGEFVETTISTPGAENIISNEPQEIVIEEAQETEEVEVIEEEQEQPVENETETDPVEIEEVEVAETETVSTTSYDLRLNEVYANTSGSDSEEEFVELINTGTTAIDLNGWSLSDASDKTYTADESQMIEPGAVLALDRDITGLALNNSGTEVVRLIAPDGTAVDELTYEKTTKGESFILLSGTWTSTNQITPNEPNQVSAAVVDDTTDTTGNSVVEETTSAPVETVVTEIAPTNNEPINSASVSVATTKTSSATNSYSYSSTSSVVETTLSAVRDLDPGTEVRVTGTVSVGPGIMGTQIMYLAGSGIQVYFYKADWPELFVGDVVELEGELSSSRDETRIKLASADDIKVLYHGDEPVPHEIELEEVDENTEGWLVTVEGMIQSVESDRFVIEDNQTTTTVIAKDGANIDVTFLDEGSRIRVTGIVSRYYDNFRVLPRSLDDIEVIEETPVMAAGTSNNRSSAARSGLAIALTLATAAALGYFAFRYYRSRKEQIPTFTAKTVDCGTPAN